MSRRLAALIKGLWDKTQKLVGRHRKEQFRQQRRRNHAFFNFPILNTVFS